MAKIPCKMVEYGSGATASSLINLNQTELALPEALN
jgi:hypothetical protein